VISRFVVNLPS